MNRKVIPTYQSALLPSHGYELPNLRVRGTYAFDYLFIIRNGSTSSDDAKMTAERQSKGEYANDILSMEAQQFNGFWGLGYVEPNPYQMPSIRM